MNSLLLPLQKSHFAYWLSQGAYPIILTLHSVGLALLVGLLIVIDVRVLGIGPGLPIPALRGYMKVVWIGFFTNAVSGTLLFCISPVKLFDSTLFRFKLLFIFAGLGLGALLNSALLRVGDEFAMEAEPSVHQRMLAGLSLACWLAAIVAGRWLAYSTFADIGVEDVP
ncbi:MAG: hypothetical protein ACLPTF_14080 [Steroidobacteraceae bacterium]